MTVTNMIIGASTDRSARVVTKVSGAGDVRLAVADNPEMSGPQFYGPVTPTAESVASVAATGLDPDTRYTWQIEHGGVLDTALTGKLRTPPLLGEPGSTFMVAVAGDAGATPEYPGEGAVLAPTRISNTVAFDQVRQADPRMFIMPGDLHYYDGYTTNGITGGPTLANIRRSYDDVLLQPRAHQLFREVASAYGPDDHDSALGNDKRGLEDLTAAANALQVYGERWPHYPLANPLDGFYQSWQIGRVLFVLLDGRTKANANGDPDGPSKTMLGSTQKTWLERTLINGRNTGAEYLVVICGSQWTLTTHGDSWNSFATERAELVDMYGDTGWLRRMTKVYADRHALGLDTGSHNLHGGFPLVMAASLDATPSQPASDRFDTGWDSPGRQQHARLTFQDTGHEITVKLAGYRGSTLWRSITTAATISNPMTPALLRTVAKSHKAVFEARVCTEFQTGADPEGTVIPILGGDVKLDATAETRGTLDLETHGEWPRGGNSLLAPFGNEIFVRRGVDLGGGQIEWVPLGYYRIEEPEQDDAPHGPITLTGADRMAGIIDARFTEPRQFTADRTVGSVVWELVGEVYPSAAIVWDDDTNQSALGRVVVFEEDRHAALMEIVTSRGKVAYWDGAGVLQIRDLPDPAEIAWEVKAGKDGVLVSAARRLSREGTYNGAVATGEGADTETPVRAVVVDRSPTSGTRWGGKFGRKPRFYASPLITTEAQALSAAKAILRKSIGFPYNVDFNALPNPAVTPDMAVRIAQEDGREVHVLQSVTIPLTADAPVTATTKEQTLIVLGEV